MYAAHDMTEVHKNRKLVTVHYNGMSEWVKVKGGVVVGSSEGGEVHTAHALVEATTALRKTAKVELD